LMADMIDNILAKSRQNKTFEAVDINLLLQRELDFLKADQMFRYQVQTKINLMRNLPKVWCVYTDLSQVFGNLLRNAVEAMHNSSHQVLSILTVQKNQTVQVVITDTGDGILEANLENLFDPFFTTKMGDGVSSPQGTGLGLYIVRQLLEEYGAKINVETEEGMGTTFSVDIPMNALVGRGDR
jgi:two-component system NtrC family sensor kinase